MGEPLTPSGRQLLRYPTTVDLQSILAIEMEAAAAAPREDAALRYGYQRGHADASAGRGYREDLAVGNWQTRWDEAAVIAQEDAARAAAPAGEPLTPERLAELYDLPDSVLMDTIGPTTVRLLVAAARAAAPADGLTDYQRGYLDGFHAPANDAARAATPAGETSSGHYGESGVWLSTPAPVPAAGLRLEALAAAVEGHWPTLIFQDGDGDLARCSCGHQGFDFKQGREWFAEHIVGLMHAALHREAGA